ncbi:unnamed protein product, partial [Laminaria digitata]
QQHSSAHRRKGERERERETDRDRTVLQSIISDSLGRGFFLEVHAGLRCSFTSQLGEKEPTARRGIALVFLYVSPLLRRPSIGSDRVGQRQLLVGFATGSGGDRGGAHGRRRVEWRRG